MKKAEYILNYRIKGKKLTKKIEIDFVPYQRHVDYGELQAIMLDVQHKWNRIQLIETEINLLTLEKPPEYIRIMKDLKNEVMELSDKIRQASDSGIVKKRYELLKEILIDNGYDDEEFLSWSFWSNSVEPSEINNILEMAISKDIEKKK